VAARDQFYFLAGALVMLCAVLVLRPLLPRGVRGEWAPLRTVLFGILGAGVLATTALGLYVWRGAPQALGGLDAATGAPHATDGQNRTPGTMESATARLAARLEREGGSAEDWQLLAKSYEFLGRPDDARRANERAAAVAAAPRNSAATVQAVAASLPMQAATTPVPAAPALDAAASADLARAETLRRKGDNAGARAIYLQLASRGQLNADGWADYADVTAALNRGTLQGEAARYIDAALRLDPQHAKALWLRASLEHEQHRDADALADWRRLQAALPADSPDQRIIGANIEEAIHLTGTAGTAAGATARITGTVELAAPLVARAPAGATLFIYARGPEGAGPPLAVLRLKAEHWPVAFVLDDGAAMIPGRALSGAGTVRVEARVSRSGNALPQAGDLVGTVTNVDPRAGRSVRIAIDRPIG
jgi:cytochrome c-type biogenesis protein CcmH